MATGRTSKHGLCVAIALLACLGAHATTGDDGAMPAAERALARCRAIPIDRDWTGLVMNPPGMHTGYYRSLCYQYAATELRDARLCRHAVERRSWFFDGSGVSPAACAREVQLQTTRDKAAARLLRDPQRPIGLTVYRDGNARDIDVLVRTSGGSGSNLWVTVAVMGESGREHVVLERRQPMDSAPGELMLFVPAADLVRALGAPLPNREIVVRVTLALRLDHPDSRAIQAHAPHIRRANSLELPVNLTALKRAPLTRIR